MRQLTAEKATDAAATDAVERQRPKLERFMPTLGTIITAAPMLGILGTVLGIIGAFDLLGEQPGDMKLEAISGKIAEALITTVAGLIIALIVLFPSNAFRAQPNTGQQALSGSLGTAALLAGLQQAFA